MHVRTCESMPVCAPVTRALPCIRPTPALAAHADDVRVFGSALSTATISRAYNASRSSHMVDMVLRLNGTGEVVNLPNTTIVGGPYVRLERAICAAVCRAGGALGRAPSLCSMSPFVA